jgi:sporulation protein YlmC with PRC-barrel domain
MHTTARLTAAVFLSLFVGAVQADCLDDLQDLKAAYTDLRPAPAAQRRIWALKKMALTLNDKGRATACHDLIRNLKEQLRDMKRLSEIRTAFHYDQDARKPVTDTEHLFRAENVIGSPVINVNNERLGIIEALTFQSRSGRIRYIVMDTAGLLSADPRPVAVPWNNLSWIESNGVFVVDADKSSLQQAPDIGSHDWPGSVNAEWITKSDSPGEDRRRPEE